MNVIINGMANAEYIGIIYELLDANPDMSVWTIYDPKLPVEFDLKYEERLHIIEHSKIFNLADYSEYVNFKITRLDSKLIQGFADIEQAVLKMMDRCNTEPGPIRRSFNYQERKNLYLKHLEFWNSFIKENEIKCFISMNIPHEIYDYIIYSLLKKDNEKKTVVFYQSQIPDVSFMIDDIVENTAYLKTCNSDHTVELNQKFQNYFSNMCSAKNPNLWYMKKVGITSLIKLKIHGFLAMLKKHKFAIIIFTIQKLKMMWFERSSNKAINNIYSKITSDYDPSKKYFFYPLHYQPEMTSSPTGREFVNQQLIVNLVSSLLPENFYLYVKEHPKQTYRTRDKNFYESMKHSNVKFIKKDVSSDLLIRNAVGVMTITGTAGWESLFLGKKVILFGDLFYKYAPGVYYVNTNQECKNAIFDIINDPVFNPELLVPFLNRIENYGINAYVDSAYEIVSDLTRDENNKNIFNAIINKLND